ncbi:MAG: DNA repair protein RecO [Planctomycetota bacterium]
MAAEKSLAIVLRVTDFSETSCVVTLLTREFGKITALAKGARRPKNPFEAAIDVLALCRIVFLRRSSGAMDLLTEARLERRFRGAQVDVNRAYAGYYVVELLRSLTIEHDPHPVAFDIACEIIERIDEGEFDQASLVGFELALLEELGHQPVFSQCATCGQEESRKGQNNDGQRVNFSIDEGGIVCNQCRPGRKNVISLSRGAWAFLESACRTRVRPENRKTPIEDAGLDASESHSGDKDVPMGEIRKVMNQYVTHLLNYPLRTSPYINTIK